ncbi:hypothetical protein FKM82_012787 [Ascaphus truei]
MHGPLDEYGRPVPACTPSTGLHYSQKWPGWQSVAISSVESRSFVVFSPQCFSLFSHPDLQHKLTETSWKLKPMSAQRAAPAPLSPVWGKGFS